MMRLALALALAGCHHHAAVNPPPPVACVDVTLHMHELLAPTKRGAGGRDYDAGQLGRMTEVVKARCTEDMWGVDARTCIVATHALDDGHHCLDKLSPAQRIAFEAALHAAVDGPKPTTSPKRRLPANCLRYRAMMEHYITCATIPQTARDAVKASLDSTWATWEGLPDDALAALDASCGSAAAATAMMTCPP